MSKQISYFENVHQVVLLIPRGRVTTYGEIAAYLGNKADARIVGWAMNAIPSELQAPAHRVVNQHGILTAERNFGEPGRMQQLLEEEGIQVVNHKIQHFSEVLWIPSKELDLSI